jgi:hypothetical protein
VNGRSLEQPLVVAMDPRVDVTNDSLAQQLSLETKIISLVQSSFEGYRQAAELRKKIADDKDLDQKLQRLQGSEGGFGGGGGGRGGRQTPSFAALNRSIGSLASIVDGQDAAPTPAMQSAYEGYCKELATLTQSWNDLLTSANADLSKQGFAPLTALPIPDCK